MTEGARASGLTREAIEAALRPTFLPRIDSIDLHKGLFATNHPSRFSKTTCMASAATGCVDRGKQVRMSCK
jgi:hypothetical protein